MFLSIGKCQAWYLVIDCRPKIVTLRMHHAEITYACAYCQTVRLHFINYLTLRTGFATYAAKAHQLNLLCVAGNFGKIWPSWGGGRGALQFQYTEKRMNKFIYNFTFLIVYSFCAIKIYIDNKRTNYLKLQVIT